MIESLNNQMNVDVRGVIHLMQIYPTKKSATKDSTLFPYIETYGKSREKEENLLMNKTIKFRENYIHSRTLRYMEPGFSYNQVLARLKTNIVNSARPRKAAKPKSYNRQTSKLKDLMTKAEVFIPKDSHLSPDLIRVTKSVQKKPRFPNGITKIKKIIESSRDHGIVSPDMLQVSRMNSLEYSKKPQKKKLENLTFYEYNQSGKDFYSDEDFNTKPKYSSQTPSRLNKPNPIKPKCDATNNTEKPT